LALPLSCCKPIDVELATEEPIKIDISMKVDVYQYGGVEKDEEKKEKEKEKLSYEAVVDRMWARMAEIQELKNNRIVGENRMGLLGIRDRPAGEYGDYVDKTVREENVDRAFLMTHETKTEGTDLAEVQLRQWRSRAQASFPGEWIEVEGNQAGRYKWTQKGGTLAPKKEGA
jgi:hypothetical protein